jgi:glycosyl transferase family 25
MASYRIFLINLDRSPDRLARMREQARDLEFDYERVRGVDGSANLPAWLRDQFDLHSGMSNGEIGCYASHLCACALIREQGLEAAIILEDDVVLDPDFAVASGSAIQSAPPGWDIVHLSTNFKKPALPVSQLGGGRTLVRYARLPSNSAAYAISAAGAAKLLAPGRRTRPYDLEFRYAWMRGIELFGVYPPLARQRSDIDSTIEAEWHDHANGGARRRGKSPTQKRWKPNLASQIQGLFFVGRRLGLAGMFHCWRLGLADGFAKRAGRK